MEASGLVIPSLLSAPDVGDMHTAALAILGRTGMAVHHAAIRAELLRRDGFTECKGRVLISAERVDEWLAAQLARCPRREQTLPAPGGPEDFRYTLLGYPVWTTTDDGRSLRPMTRADCVAGAKLTQVLAARGVVPACPGVPTDVPPRLQPLEQFLISAEHCENPSGGGLEADIATAEIIHEMNAALGRELGVSVWLPNPLAFGGATVDILWRFREQVRSISVGSMPAMGMSGPCEHAANMVFCLAEIVGGAAIIQALWPEIPVGIFPHPQAADMRTGTMMMGTPEWELFDHMRRDVLAWYGVDWSTKLIHTSASLPGPQAQMERMTGALLGVLGGYRRFHGLGTLGIDEVWCPAQALLDLDLVAHAARIARGPAPVAELDLAHLPEIVDEVVRGDGLFIGHESTARAVRQQYQQPHLLQRLDRAQWAAAGQPDLLEEAHREAERLVGEHSYAAPAELLAELRRIAERGKERLR